MPRASGFLWNPSGSRNGPVVVSRDRYEDPEPIFPPRSAPPREGTLYIEYRPESRLPRSAILPSSRTSLEVQEVEVYQTEYRRPGQSRQYEMPLRLTNYPHGQDPHTIPPPSPGMLLPAPQRPVIIPAAQPQPIVLQQPRQVPPPAPEVPAQGAHRYYTPAGQPIRETPSLRVNIPAPSSGHRSRGASEASSISASGSSPRSHRSRTSGESSHRRRKHRRTHTPDTPVSENDRHRKSPKLLEEATYEPHPWEEVGEVRFRGGDGAGRTTQYYYR